MSAKHPSHAVAVKALLDHPAMLGRLTTARLQRDVAKVYGMWPGAALTVVIAARQEMTRARSMCTLRG